MSSTIKANASRATRYMAFPQNKAQVRAGKETFIPKEGLGGLLEGVGPSAGELSITGLLRYWMRFSPLNTH